MNSKHNEDHEVYEEEGSCNYKGVSVIPLLFSRSGIHGYKVPSKCIKKSF
jgi:hypothetical protein